MGIWDKGEALSYPRLTDTFEEGRPFTLLGMRETAPVDLDNELDPAPVNVLTVRGASEQPGASPLTTAWTAYGETAEVGVISQPINELVKNATADDFPVVVKWAHVKTKRFANEATVLQIVSRTVDVSA